MDGSSTAAKGKRPRGKGSPREDKRRRICVMDALPNELWTLVFNGTDRRCRPMLDPRWRFCAAQVCRSFRACVASPTVREADRLKDGIPRGASPDAWVAGRVLCASAMRDAVSALPLGSACVAAWQHMGVSAIGPSARSDGSKTLTVAAALIASGHRDAMLGARCEWLSVELRAMDQNRPWFEEPCHTTLSSESIWVARPQRWEPAYVGLNLLLAACRAGSAVAVGFLLKRYAAIMFASTSSRAPICFCGDTNARGDFQTRDLYTACVVDAVRVGAVDVVATLIDDRTCWRTRCMAWEAAWNHCAKAPARSDIAMMTHLVNVFDRDSAVIYDGSRPYKRTSDLGLDTADAGTTERVEWLPQGEHWCRHVLQDDRPALFEAAMVLCPDHRGRPCGPLDVMHTLSGVVARGATASVAWLVDRNRTGISEALATGEGVCAFVKITCLVMSTFDCLVAGVDALANALPSLELSSDDALQQCAADLIVWDPLFVVAMRLHRDRTLIPPEVLTRAVRAISHTAKSGQFDALDVLVDTIERNPAMAGDRVDLWATVERAHRHTARCNTPWIRARTGDCACMPTAQCAATINALRHVAQRAGFIESDPTTTTRDGRFFRDPECWRRWCRPRPIEANTHVARSSAMGAADSYKALVAAGLFFPV